MPSPHSWNRSTPRRKRVLLALYWWEDRVFEGVAKFAAEQGWILDCKMRWTHAVPSKSDWRGDGIIANPGFSKPIKPLIELIESSAAPTVGLQTFGNYPSSARVLQDHHGIGVLGAQNFASLNFHHLGFVRFADNPIEAMRAKAFEDTANQLGLEFHSFHFKDFAQQIRQAPKPIGLMAMNDLNAISLMTACLDAGLSIPEEVALLGADDSRIMCDTAEIPLSSVNCNFEAIGYRAAETLHRLMAGEKVDAPEEVLPPTGITVRRSSDTIAIPDPDAAKALRIIRDHFKTPLSIGEIADQLGVSIRRLQISFQKHLGFTMIQELTRIRVQHAKRMLLDPKLKLEAVALDSGFTSRFHLIRAFQRTTGETPAAYRRSVISQ